MCKKGAKNRLTAKSLFWGAGESKKEYLFGDPGKHQEASIGGDGARAKTNFEKTGDKAKNTEKKQHEGTRVG